ncbi:MAG: ATP-binding protein [Bacteroidales bacterium]|nr:ATP-binding protein [Bacteroidales bacterium]
MIFKRKLYEKMLLWKNNRQGKTALLIKGARRVGKSTLVEDFAKKEYKSYILIDFSETSKQINPLFEDMHDLDFFFFSLQNITGVSLIKRESVIVFDEVQFNPRARQAIKHLVKDGRYDYIETGSLISIRKNVQNILIPSEEESLTLHPMDLDEFYWATGKEIVTEQLRQAFEMKCPMGDAVHRKWMRELRLYMLVGGMPQAVDAYLQYNDLREVDDVKRHILELYDNDFMKIDSSGRASKLFAAIPSQLNNNASRYQVGSVIENQTAERLAETIFDIQDSKAVVMAYHVTAPNVGMGMFKDYSRYKMFIADTGLFITLAFKNKLYTENIIYQKLLSDKLDANLGYVYENLVAQMLYAAGNDLFYYTFPSVHNHNYELDFLLQQGGKIVPIEVKSSGYKSHKSLDAFCEKFSSRIGNRILLYTKDYHRDEQTECLPVYFAGLL